MRSSTRSFLWKAELPDNWFSVGCLWFSRQFAWVRNVNTLGSCLTGWKIDENWKVWGLGFFSLESLEPKLPRIATVVEDVPSVDKNLFFLTHCRSFKLCTSWQHSEWWVTILLIDRPPLLLLSIRVLRQRWEATSRSADHNWEATRQRSKCWRLELAPPLLSPVRSSRPLFQQNRLTFTFFYFLQEASWILVPVLHSR